MLNVREKVKGKAVRRRGAETTKWSGSKMQVVSKGQKMYNEFIAEQGKQTYSERGE